MNFRKIIDKSNYYGYNIPCLLNAGVAEWQTHQTQNLTLATVCGFKSHLLHLKTIVFAMVFCCGDEESGHCACTSGHLTSANQSEMRRAYLVSVLHFVHD